MLIERLPTDTNRSYQALCKYAALGPQRSLEKYRYCTGKTPAFLRQLERWSSAHHWAIRIRAYDQSVALEEEQARGAVRRARRLFLEEDDWTTGQAVRDQCRALLEALPKFITSTSTETQQDGQTVNVVTLKLHASVGELARALTLASQLQRLSVGVPTAHDTQEISVHYEDAAQALDAKLLRYSDQARGELAGFLDRCESALDPDVYAQLLALAARS